VVWNIFFEKFLGLIFEEFYLEFDKYMGLKNFKRFEILYNN